MKREVKPIPKEYRAVTPYLMVRDAARVIEFHKEAIERAVAAGAESRRPVQNMFWGDRTGEVSDPSGHIWTLATRVEELSEKEVAERAREAFEKMMPGSARR